MPHHSTLAVIKHLVWVPQSTHCRCSRCAVLQMFWWIVAFLWSHFSHNVLHESVILSHPCDGFPVWFLYKVMGSSFLQGFLLWDFLNWNCISFVFVFFKLKNQPSRVLNRTLSLSKKVIFLERCTQRVSLLEKIPCGKLEQLTIEKNSTVLESTLEPFKVWSQTLQQRVSLTIKGSS